MAERLSFQDEISRNKMKSVLLIGAILFFFIVLGFIIALILDPGYFFFIMILAIIISLLYTVISYYNADKIALASVRASEALKLEHRRLYDAVENMSLASGLPMPRVYVMQSDEINAFASGRDPKHSVICVTTGALKNLNKEELEGVIAHEMSHIANYDIRFMTLTAVLVGMVAILAEVFLRSLWFSSDDNKDRSGMILIIVGIAFAILAPIAVHLVSLAISRKREFSADATAVKFTRYPPGLKGALEKIKEEGALKQGEEKKFPKAVAPLFIADPFKKKFQNAFSTHPPIEDRIKKLDAM